MRRLPHLVLALAVTVGATACGSSSGSAVDLTGKRFVDRRGEKTVEIEAVDNSFDPQFVTVSPGTEVTFVNVGRNRHNVLPSDGGFRAIDIDALEPDESATRTFTEVRDSPYYCSLHGTPTAGMMGAIRVADQ